MTHYHGCSSCQGLIFNFILWAQSGRRGCNAHVITKMANDLFHTFSIQIKLVKLMSTLFFKVQEKVDNEFRITTFKRSILAIYITSISITTARDDNVMNSSP